MKITFLGTGTSHGVPMIGCRCRVCSSDDPRDKRSRPSVWIQAAGELSLLIDTSPDLRSQALTFGIDRVDAILYTHSHADHVLGFDEVRRFNALQRGPIQGYGDQATLDDLRRMFPYAFEDPPPMGGGVPQLETHVINGPFHVGSVECIPVPIKHGAREILGFRVEGFAYLTDCSEIPSQSWPLLRDVEVLVLSALRHRPHPTHMTLAAAIETAERVAARRTLFTHMCHDLGHAETSATLPAGMELAYDGLVLTT